MAGERRVIDEDVLLKDARENCRCKDCNFCQKQYEREGLGCESCHFMGTTCEEFPYCKTAMES